jgi:ParB/RepB/Spo0J family partition protein
MMLIPIKQIKLRTYNRDDKDDITGLAASIQEHGLINPIVVTELKKNQFQLIAGERRLRATQHNGGKEIYCSVIQADELQQQKLNLAENLQRKDLTIWEESKHVQELKDLQPEARVEDLAVQIGRSAPWVAHRLQLAKLHPDLQKIFQQQNWPISHIARLSRYGHDFQGQIAKGILERQSEQWNTDWVQELNGKRSGTYPSLSDLKHWIDRFETLLKSAIWKLDDAGLLPKAGACTACPKRSSQQGLLFQEPGDGEDDTCLDPECFQKKKVEFVKLGIEKLKKDKQKPLYFGDTYAAAVPGLPKADSQSWNFSQVKKTTAGAVPAIYVNGSDLGKTVWVVKERGYQTESQTSRRQISQETGKPAPPSTKERLQSLTNKRLCAAVEIWRTKTLPELKPTLNLLLPVLGVVGTAGRKSYLDQSDWKDHAELIKLIDFELAQQLYHEVFPVLADRCKRIGTVDDGEKLWQEAVRQAQAFDADADLLACWDSAIREVKFPTALKKDEVVDPHQFGHFPILGKKGKS